MNRKGCGTLKFKIKGSATRLALKAGHEHLIANAIFKYKLFKIYWLLVRLITLTLAINLHIMPVDEC